MKKDIFPALITNQFATNDWMKKIKKLIFFSLLISLILLSSAVSAAEEQITIDRAYFPFNTGEVMLFADIPEAVLNANPDTILLTINGAAAKTPRISSFCRSDIPLTFLFLVNTTKTVYASEKDRPEEIIRAFRDFYFFQGHSKIAIMTYGDAIQTVLEPTSDAEAINLAAIRIRFTSQNSNYQEALATAVDYLEKLSENDGSFKQIILLTDGKGYDHRFFSEEEMIQSLQEAEIPLFVLNTLDTNAFYGDEAKDHAESASWYATTFPELYPLATPEASGGAGVNYDLERLKRIAGATGGLAVKASEGSRSEALAKRMMDAICAKTFLSATLPDGFSANLQEPIEFSLDFFNGRTYIAGVTSSIYADARILSVQ